VLFRSLDPGNPPLPLRTVDPADPKRITSFSTQDFDDVLSTVIGKSNRIFFALLRFQ
jgi:hypothetical protein